jgi:hypothetical protein
MDNLSNRRKRKVFLGYASEDKNVSRKIAELGREIGLEVRYSEYELLPGDLISEKIGKVISSSDYLFLLLSRNSAKSRWINSEASESYLDDLITRGVTVVPVLIGNCRAPEYFLKFQIFYLRRDLHRNIRKLFNQIANAPRIDFSSLTAYAFMELVSDLLKKLHFRNIRREHRIADKGIDIMAEYMQKDPFGMKRKEVWIIETKFYRKERASLSALHQLVGSLAGFPSNYKALLVTNSLLTSYAKDWLAGIRTAKEKDIRIIEGPELKNLLLRFPELINQYFPPRAQEG